MHYDHPAEKLYQNSVRLINTTKNLADANISLLLYGPPGTGKTEFAYQLARQTGADIMQLDFSQLHSKWIGETEKNIRMVFSDYQKRLENTERPIILLMNEADGLMNRRVTVSTSNDIFSNQVQSQLLEILEEFKGILVATTNLYKNIDEAFHRRFLFRCQINNPEYEVRKRLLEDSLLKRYLSARSTQKLLSVSWSAAQLKNMDYKVEQLGSLEELNEQSVLELLEQDGLLKEVSAIGFRIT